MMPNLKAKLLPLFQATWDKGSLPPTAIQQTELVLASKALQALDGKSHAVSCEQLSFDALHRHIMVIACPDQAFYPDAIRAYLQKQQIQPLQQFSILYDANLSPHLNGHHGLLLVFHFAAATLPLIAPVQRAIEHVLQGVWQSVNDFPDMLGCLENIAAHMAEDAPDVASLLRWMLADNYLLFGLFGVGVRRHNKGICKNKACFHPLFRKLMMSLLRLNVPTR